MTICQGGITLVPKFDMRAWKVAGLFASLLYLSLTASCNVLESTAIVAPAGSTASLSSGANQDSVDMQMLSRSIAIALRSDDLRASLFEDLRDSPFERHGLELSSYLRGRRGEALLTAAAKASGVSPTKLLGTLSSLRGRLEFSVPRSTDQFRWRGTADIIVLGTTRNPGDFSRSTAYADGYDVYGNKQSVYLRGPGRLPYLALHPAIHDFGSDPEVVRQRAPRRLGKNIDGSGVVSPNLVPCGPDECGNGGGSPTVGPGYVMPHGMTYAQCVNSPNAALVDPVCRADLAWAFRPRLLIQQDEPCPVRDPYWSVVPYGDGKTIQIFYAISWWNDCGNRSGTADSHDGDSEFILVRVTTRGPEGQPQAWYLTSVFLTAHLDVLGFDSSWNGTPPSIQFRSGEDLLRPKVYVAYGKHGNYRDVGSCERGARGFDNCSWWMDDGSTEFGGTMTYGYGSDLGYHGAQMRDCVTSRLSRPGTECYWTPYPNYASGTFSGWTGNPSGSTPYSEFLYSYGH